MAKKRKVLHDLGLGHYGVIPYEIDSDDFFVSYVDILGFKDIIQADPAGKEFLPLIENAVKRGLHYAKLVKELGGELEYRIFSDNVCFWIPVKHGAVSFMALLATLAGFQFNLVSNGLLCRGGISMGFHYSSEYTIYGPAIVKAVELEHIASYPRILIDSEILQDENIITAPFFSFQLAAVEDEHVFINYLWMLFYVEEDLFSTKREAGISNLRSHRDTVLKGLEKYKDSPKILQKYKWLKDYHNLIVGLLDLREQNMGISQEVIP